jgi:cytochrome P450
VYFVLFPFSLVSLSNGHIAKAPVECILGSYPKSNISTSSMKPPEFSIDLKEFWVDPYPALAQMRSSAPICYVPEFDATLLTRRDDVFSCEKKIDVFSSCQPEGLMVQLMGENMMRKDGDAHIAERRQVQPSFSPATVKSTWVSLFKQDTLNIIDGLRDRATFDVALDYAMPVSASALRHITGLRNLTLVQLDEVSQAMIDGISNYSGDGVIAQRCQSATQLVDDSIEELLRSKNNHHSSMISVLTRAGQPIESIRANIKLAISGGRTNHAM